MISILFIHQSAELYGSDKTLLLLLKKVNRTSFNPVVVLPNDGPLKAALEKENIQVVIAPVLKLYRKMITPKNLFKFFKDIKKSRKILDQLHKKHHFEIVYSNTLAVLLGIIFANKRNIKHLWHIHEIIESPKIFTHLFCSLLALKANTQIIYNSNSTQNFWNVNQSISKKGQVIYNGIETHNTTIEPLENNGISPFPFPINPSDKYITLVGRISRLKGHKWTLNTYINYLAKDSTIKLLFVGSPVEGQEHYLHEIEQIIEDNKLENNVTILPFTTDLSSIWALTTVAIMPSTEAESFGLVAAEAMLAKKPVVGSNKGGITEIIQHNETGFLVPTNDEREFASAVLQLLENEELRTSFGQKGHQRIIDTFSVEKYVKSFEAVFHKLV